MAQGVGSGCRYCRGLHLSVERITFYSVTRLWIRQQLTPVEECMLTWIPLLRGVGKVIFFLREILWTGVWTHSQQLVPFVNFVSHLLCMLMLHVSISAKDIYVFAVDLSISLLLERDSLMWTDCFLISLRTCLNGNEIHSYSARYMYSQLEKERKIRRKEPNDKMM